MKFLNLFAITLSLFFATAASAADATTNKDYKEAAASAVSEFDKYVKDVKDFEASEKFNPKLLEENLEGDINLGNPEAKVKIVEYASLTCIHCKEFHKDIFFDLKKNYIDTGKVSFKYRHYPLNASAVKAAQMVGCAEEKDRMAFVSALFDSQSQWGYATSEADLMGKLKTITKIVGFSDEKFQQCWDNQATTTLIMQLQKRGYDELNVTSTPAIFVNGHRYLEGRDYATVAKYIDELLKAPAAAGQTVKAEKK